MKPLWLVQTNMGSNSDISNIIISLKDLKIDFCEVTEIPFSDDLPNIDYSGPVICYGSTWFIKKCLNSKKWFPAVWHDDNFSYSAWVKNYNSLLLNSPDNVVRTTIGDYIHDTTFLDNDMVFVRPEYDYKEFCGEVMESAQFKKWCQTIQEGGFNQVTADTKIVVGVPYGITSEWRLFVVDGKVVAGSLYKDKGVLNKSSVVPKNVIDYGNMVAKLWSPASVFTLDICSSNNSLYILEAQGFNSAGHYATDLNILFQAVTNQAVKEWTDNNGGNSESN